MCAEQNLKLDPRKCILFVKSIMLCDRLISADEIRYDPKRIERLLNMATADWCPFATIYLRASVGEER